MFIADGKRTLFLRITDGNTAFGAEDHKIGNPRVFWSFYKDSLLLVRVTYGNAQSLVAKFAAEYAAEYAENYNNAAKRLQTNIQSLVTNFGAEYGAEYADKNNVNVGESTLIEVALTSTSQYNTRWS